MLAHVLIPRTAVWSSWIADPFVIGSAGVACAVYIYGYGAVRGFIGRWRLWYFLAGASIAVLSTMSPLHAASEAILSAHMLQHLLLMLVAAPLLVLGNPSLVFGLAIPVWMRRRMWTIARSKIVAPVLSAARGPLGILLLYAGVLWVWHLPGLYQLAVRSAAAHAAEHACFLGASAAFWACALHTGPRRRHAHVPAMLLVLGTMLQTSWLAAVLTFGHLAYPLYATRAAAWHVNALGDQQIAGVLMWLPMTIVFMTVFGALLMRWLRDLNARFAQRPVGAT